MTPDFAHAASGLLDDFAATATAGDLAERAAHACEQFVARLSRLLGETGIRLLLKRSIATVSPQFPWLAQADGTGASVRQAMQEQDPAAIREAFIAILAAFVGLLERLIGEPLVARLLDEVWPSVFTHTEQETP